MDWVIRGVDIHRPIAPDEIDYVVMQVAPVEIS